jgi:hypothetical protein
MAPRLRFLADKQGMSLGDYFRKVRTIVSVLEVEPACAKCQNHV